MSEDLSKTADKKRQRALKLLADRLVALPANQLRALDLPQHLLEAIEAMKRMHAHGARRRQRQLITKHLRSIDAEAVAGALHRLTADERQQKALFKHAEHWRDRIVRDGDTALRELFAGSEPRYSELAALVRDLATAANETRKRTLKRRLFRVLHAEFAENRPSSL